MNILLNNRIVPRESFTVDLEDRGFQFGDGIYEVIRIYDGVFFEWEAHLERLVWSAKELMLPLPAAINTLYQNLQLLVKDSKITNGTVYIQVTRGTAPRFHALPEKAEPTLVAYVREMQRPLEQMKKGIKAVTAEDIRWLRVDIKSLNLLGNVLAKQKAVEQGGAEAILIRDGIVTEGSSSNLFAIKDKQCFTHPANHLILNGITRQVVLRLLNDIDLTLQETSFTLDELLEMDEVFITNTGQEVCPVIQIDDFVIRKGTPGVYTRRLQSGFEALLGSVIPS